VDDDSLPASNEDDLEVGGVDGEESDILSSQGFSRVGATTLRLIYVIIWLNITNCQH